LAGEEKEEEWGKVRVADVADRARVAVSPLVVKFVQKRQKNLIKELCISNIKMKNEK
jgi:hypothetical protein